MPVHTNGGAISRAADNIRGFFRGPVQAPGMLPPPASNQPLPQAIQQLARQNFPPIERLNLTPVPGTSLTPVSASATIKTKRPITKIHGILTVLKADGTAAGDVQDNIRRFLHSLSLEHGGTPIQVYGNDSGAAGGGQMIFPISKGWDQTTPRQDATVVGGNNNGRYFFSIPISVPPTFYAKKFVNQSALRIGDDTTWRVAATGGTVADLFTTPGTGSITTATLELFTEVDDTLSPAYPVDSFQLFTGFERQIIPATVQTRQAERLNQNGRVLCMGLQQRDNLLRSNAILTDVAYLLDQSQNLFDGSWNSLEWLLQISGDGALAVPEIGWGFIDFDPGKNMMGVPAAQSAGWQIVLTNIAGGANLANDGIMEQTFWALPLGALSQ